MAEASRRAHTGAGLGTSPASARPPRRTTKAVLLVALLAVGAVAAGVILLRNDGPYVPPRAVHDPRTRPAGDVFPDGVVVDVKQYGATGDGITDDTKAIQSAIRDNAGDELARTLFFPNGTYVVSDRLVWQDNNGRWSAFLTLQGESREGTVIRLADSTRGYDDPKKPRAVLFTASEALRTPVNAGSLNWTGAGEGNEAFRNSIFDMTVDTGAGNPGAIGIDYLANNVGSIRNVDVRSGDGGGVAGIAMTRQWPGPALLQDVAVSGFDYGVHVAQPEYSLTFERLTLHDQRVAGLRNDGNVLAIHSLFSDNSVPAIENTRDSGLITLVNADLRGGDSSETAIVNSAGEVFLREVSAHGYRYALDDRGKRIESAIGEYASTGDGAVGASAGRSLALPVAETPVVPMDDPHTWANVEDYGARGLTAEGTHDFEDDTAAIQRAIDSGARTVYLPRGFYKLSDTVHIRGDVQRVVFAWSWLGVTESNVFGDGRPLFAFDDGSAATVLIEQLGPYSRTTTQEPPPTLLHDSSRTLVIRDSALYGYSNTPGSGPLFLENVVGSPWRFRQQDVWARQFNLEGSDQPMVRNEGSKLWVLGLKTELPFTIIEGDAEAHTEVLGGLLYPVDTVTSRTPAFSFAGGSWSLSYATSSYTAPENYPTQVSITRPAAPRSIESSNLLERGYGTLVPLLTDAD